MSRVGRARGSFVLLQNGGRALFARAGAHAGGDRTERRRRADHGWRERARADASHRVSPLDGLRASVRPTSRSCTSAGARASSARRARCRTLRDGPPVIEYFAGRERAGEAGARRGRGSGPGSRGSVRSGGGVPDEFSLRVRAPSFRTESGTGRSRRAGGPGALVLRRRTARRQLESDRAQRRVHGLGSEEAAATIELIAGERYEVVVERPAAPAFGGLEIGLLAADSRRHDRSGGRRGAARRRGRCASSVPTATGRREGHDRESMELPPPQDDLVRAVAAVNRRTIVVVNAASPVTMPWADDVAAILQCWFPGEEWGNALADVLSGDVSPSGKLPTTFPMRLEDTPAFTNYPGEHGAGAVRRGCVRRLPLVRRARDRTALLLRSRALVHDVRVREADAHHRSSAVGCHSEHRRAPRRRSRAVLRRPARTQGPAPAAGTEGIRQGRTRSWRGTHRRHSRSTAARSRTGMSPNTTGSSSRASTNCESDRRRATSDSAWSSPSSRRKGREC